MKIRARDAPMGASRSSSEASCWLGVALLLRSLFVYSSFLATVVERRSGGLCSVYSSADDSLRRPPRMTPSDNSPLCAVTMTRTGSKEPLRRMGLMVMRI